MQVKFSNTFFFCYLFKRQNNRVRSGEGSEGIRWKKLMRKKSGVECTKWCWKRMKIWKNSWEFQVFDGFSTLLKHASGQFSANSVLYIPVSLCTDWAHLMWIRLISTYTSVGMLWIRFLFVIRNEKEKIFVNLSVREELFSHPINLNLFNPQLHLIN